MRQIAEKTDILSSEIVDLYEEAQGTGKEPENSQLINGFTGLTKKFSQSIVVLDALDEQQDRKELIAVIEELGTRCKILITSRPLEDIKASTNSSLSLEIVAAESDIEQYIDMRIRDNVDLNDAMSPNFKQEIITRVVAIAGGV